MFEEKLSRSQKALLNLVTKNEPGLQIKNATFCGCLNQDQALNIYKNNYYQNLTKALGNTYEACLKILTKDLFSKLSYSFIKENPFQNNDLAVYGAEFPRLLRKKGPMDVFPFLYELAILERSIKNIFLHSKKSETYESMKITHPVHQIWGSLLYEEREEIIPLDKEKKLLISRQKENIFFKSHLKRSFLPYIFIYGNRKFIWGNVIRIETFLFCP